MALPNHSEKTKCHEMESEPVKVEIFGMGKTADITVPPPTYSQTIKQVPAVNTGDAKPQPIPRPSIRHTCYDIVEERDMHFYLELLCRIIALND